MKNRLRRIGVSLLLLSVVPPAWVLRDSIIPQTAGLVLGGPVLLLLLFGFVWAVKDKKASPASQVQLVIVALWGLLFHDVWLWLLCIFDPNTWGMVDGWSEAGFVGRYAFPAAVLAPFLLYSRRARRAATVMVSCLLMGVEYWLLAT